MLLCMAAAEVVTVSATPGVATATISGRVLDQDGTPANSVQVQASGSQGLLDQARTGGQGRFILTISDVSQDVTVDLVDVKYGQLKDQDPRPGVADRRPGSRRRRRHLVVRRRRGQGVERGQDVQPCSGSRRLPAAVQAAPGQLAPVHPAPQPPLHGGVRQGVPAATDAADRAGQLHALAVACRPGAGEARPCPSGPRSPRSSSTTSATSTTSRRGRASAGRGSCPRGRPLQPRVRQPARRHCGALHGRPGRHQPAGGPPQLDPVPRPGADGDRLRRHVQRAVRHLEAVEVQTDAALGAVAEPRRDFPTNLEPRGRWSFSSTRLNDVDFSQARVRVTRAGHRVPLARITRSLYYGNMSTLTFDFKRPPVRGTCTLCG